MNLPRGEPWFSDLRLIPNFFVWESSASHTEARLVLHLSGLAKRLSLGVFRMEYGVKKKERKKKKLCDVRTLRINHCTGMYYAM